LYTPDQVGTYYLQTHFPEQVSVNATTRDVPANTVMEASSSPKYALTVMQTPIPIYPGFPMPAEYWTRPIDDQLREWNTIAGSWVAKPNNLLAPYNDAPETPHILWAKPLAMGGLVGGDLGFSGMESGDAYEGKWSGNTIINGMLFYNRFTNRGGPLSQGVVAVDLRTGEELWFRNNTAISFGQLLYWSSFNYHGTFAYLWEVIGTKWNAYEAFTGEWAYSMTNVPSGTNVYDKNGNILRYIVDLNNGWMAMWNSTRAVNPQNFNTSQDGSWASIQLERHIMQ